VALLARAPVSRLGFWPTWSLAPPVLRARFDLESGCSCHSLGCASVLCFPLGPTWFRVLRFLPRQELFSTSVSRFRRSGFRVPPSLFVSGLTVGVEAPRFPRSIVLQVVALVCKKFLQVKASLVLNYRITGSSLASSHICLTMAFYSHI
jgi:hypothetical protein